MTNRGAGSRGGTSISTFYRAWRENQLRAAVTYDDSIPAGRLIKRSELDKVLRKESEERDIARKAVTVNCPPPTLEELRQRGNSALKSWRLIRNMTPQDLCAATSITRNVLIQLENGTRKPTSEQSEILAKILNVSIDDIS